MSKIMNTQKIIINIHNNCISTKLINHVKIDIQMINLKKKSGFTILEVLLVMGILAILIGFTLTKLNTLQRSREAHDLERKAESREIYSGVSQYIVDNLAIPAGIPTGTPDDAKDICQQEVTGTDCTGLTINGVDLASLAPEYMVEIPVDPAMTGSTVTGYKIYSDGDDVTVIASMLGQSVGMGSADPGEGEGGGGGATSGLLAHLKIDEGSGTSTSDETGNGYSASLEGQPAWTTGILDDALQFDGANDYAEIPDNDVFDGVTEFTLSTWIQPYSHKNAHILGITDVYSMDMRSDGRINFRVNGTIYGTSTSYIPTVHHWHHIALTYDGSNIKLYVNGVIDSNVTSSPTITQSSTPFTIASGSNGYHGRVDDVRISNEALTSTEIASLFTAGISGSQIAYWKFDDGSGTDVADSSGNSNDATVTGAAWNYTSTSPINFANSHSLDFDGGAGDYVSLPNTVLDGELNFTTSFWIRTTKNSGDQYILSGAKPGQDEEIAIYFDSSNVIRMQNRNNNVYWYTPHVHNNSWHHIAVVRNASNSAGTIYFDGANYGRKTISSLTLSISSGGLFIGQDQDSVGGGFSSSQAVSGQLDDFRIFNRPLTHAEVKILAGGDQLP